MMKWIFLFVLCLPYVTRAQDGFFSKKNIFGLELFGNNPRLNGHYQENIYQFRKGAMKETKEYVNYGASLYYSRNMSNKFSLGAEFYTRVFNAPSPTFDTIRFGDNTSLVQSDTIYLKMESLQFLTRGGMLRFEFHTKNGIGPVGFTHQVGLGYSETQLKKTFYRYTLNEFGDDQPGTETEVDVFNIQQEWTNFKSITTQYGLGMRYPITKSLAIDAGVKFLMNIFIRPSQEEFISIKSDPFNYRLSYFDVQRKSFLSVNAKIGIAYLF